ncbi:MAG TPA: hypothetical protein VH916_00640 [Dehalococcoidia bacterium]
MTGEIDLRFGKRYAEPLKRLGYRRHPQGMGWVRPLKKAWFPRFHLYAEVDWTARLVRLDLHLDREREHPDARRPTASADSPEVAAELSRILEIFPTPA